MDYTEETDTFLEAYNLPRQNHKETETLSIPITSKEIEQIIKKLPTKRRQGPDGFAGELYQIFKEKLMLTLLRLLQKT